MWFTKLGGLRLSQVPIISLDSVRQPFCDIFWVGDGRYLAASFTMRTWRGGRTSIWFSAWVGFDHWPCQPKHQFGEHAQCQGLNEARPLLETLSVPKVFFLSGSLLWHILELLGKPVFVFSRSNLINPWILMVDAISSTFRSTYIIYICFIVHTEWNYHFVSFSSISSYHWDVHMGFNGAVWRVQYYWRHAQGMTADVLQEEHVEIHE